ncbi:MAG: hypothetical protein R3E96_03145 [Planctomycetota bacterium]
MAHDGFQERHLDHRRRQPDHPHHRPDLLQGPVPVDARDAATLCVGIVTSMISVLVLTRVLVHLALERGVGELEHDALGDRSTSSAEPRVSSPLPPCW